MPASSRSHAPIPRQRDASFRNPCDSGGMKAFRLLLVTLSASLALAALSVVALAAPGAIGRVASPSAGAATAVYCPAGELARRKSAVTRYQKQMAKAKAAYYRKVRSAKLRKAFVKKQTAQLKALQRAVNACD